MLASGRTLSFRFGRRIKVYLGCTLLPLGIACGDALSLGTYQLPSEGGNKPSGGSPAATDDESSGGSAENIGGESPLAPRFPWSTGFETGDFADIVSRGRTAEIGNAELSVGPVAQTGSFGMLARTHELSPEVPQALALVDGPPNGRFSASFRIPEAYQTAYWVILKFRHREDLGSNMDAFDVDVESTDDGDYRLVLWEHGVDNSRIAESSETFSPGQWIRVRVDFRSSQDNDGFLRVWQDDSLVMDTGLRATIPKESALTFAVGSVAEWIEPVPADIHIDDVNVSELPP